MRNRDILGRWEEAYLLSIWELGEKAYGVTIKQAVSEKTGRELSYGGLYFTLAQLVKKGLAKKSAGEPSPKRGGRRKFYYSLTCKGKAALREAFDFQKAL